MQHVKFMRHAGTWMQNSDELHHALHKVEKNIHINLCYFILCFILLGRLVKESTVAR